MSVDLDGHILFYLIQGGSEALDHVRRKKVTKDLLKKPAAKNAFELISSQLDEGGSPSVEDVTSFFGVVVTPTSMTLSWVIDHIHRRREFNKIGESIPILTDAINENNPVFAKKIVLELADNIREDPSQAQELTNIFGMGQLVKDEYEKNEKGEMFIPTPWPSLNNMTQGLVPGTNSWFLARPGVGKTWIIVIMCAYAWLWGNENHKPLSILIVSPEMGKVSMAERFFAFLTQMSYGQIVGATLGEFGKADFFKSIDSFSDEKGIYIIDPTDSLTPQSIELAIETAGADIVIIDSAYKIQWKERAKDRTDNMNEGVGIISSWSHREWAGERKVCFLAASQMNREGTNSKKGGLGHSAVALSDALTWEADNLFFLEQTLDMKQDKVMKLVTQKCRRQVEFVPEVSFQWDMDKMVFDEFGSGEFNTNYFEKDDFVDVF